MHIIIVLMTTKLILISGNVQFLPVASCAILSRTLSCDHVTIISSSEYNSTDEDEEGKRGKRGRGREEETKLRSLINFYLLYIQTACCDIFALHSSPSPFSHLSLSFIVLKDMLYHT